MIAYLKNHRMSEFLETIGDHVVFKRYAHTGWSKAFFFGVDLYISWWVIYVVPRVLNVTWFLLHAHMFPWWFNCVWLYDLREVLRKKIFIPVFFLSVTIHCDPLSRIFIKGAVFVVVLMLLLSQQNLWLSRTLTSPMQISYRKMDLFPKEKKQLMVFN